MCINFLDINAIVISKFLNSLAIFQKDCVCFYKLFEIENTFFVYDVSVRKDLWILNYKNIAPGARFWFPSRDTYNNISELFSDIETPPCGEVKS